MLGEQNKFHTTMVKLSLANKLANRINYSFKNTQLLEEALTHPSVVRSRNEIDKIKHSERYEFVGDSVLNLVITDMLFKMFPDEKVGRLTVRRKHLVDGNTLSEVAKNIHLCDLIIKDNNNSGKCNAKSLENALEALIGAIYFDSGYDKAREFILQYWETIAKEREAYEDPKTALQQWALNNKQPLPSYRTIHESGPKHKPLFTVRANVYYLGTATATAFNKKEAQTKAAEILLRKLKTPDNNNCESATESKSSQPEDICEAPQPVPEGNV